jgi:type I restriction enzyme S subunit
MTGQYAKVSLGECCEIISGATPKISVEEYWDGEFCWATPKDLSNLGAPYIADTQRKITAAGLQSCATRLLPTGSVLLSSRAPIGYVAINEVPMATNQGFKNLIPDPSKVGAKYLYHWIRANRIYLDSLGNGATFKEVSKEVVSRVEIPLPNIMEQRQIAEVLDQAEVLRVKRRQALAQLDELIRSIFLDMFGDPVRNTKDFPLVRLGDLTDIGNGSTPSRKSP